MEAAELFEIVSPRFSTSFNMYYVDCDKLLPLLSSIMSTKFLMSLNAWSYLQVLICLEMHY